MASLFVACALPTPANDHAASSRRCILFSESVRPSRPFFQQAGPLPEPDDPHPRLRQGWSMSQFCCAQSATGASEKDHA